MTKTQQLIHELKNGLTGWYDFPKDARILYVPDSGRLPKKNGDYDYIVSVAVPERMEEPLKYLKRLRDRLTPDGTLLLGMNNRYGLHFFCGDRDPYTGRVFDSIENYWRAYQKEEDQFRGRCYAREEITALLSEAGFSKQKYYSVISNLEHPSMLFSEDYLPNEDLANRVFPEYHYPRTVFLEEEHLYDGLIQNGMFHQMANAWLIECPLAGTFADVLHVTSSLERGRERAVYTIIHADETVEKRAAYPEGEERLGQIEEYQNELKLRGIRTVPTEIRGKSLVSPKINAKVGQLYLKELLKKSKADFLNAMDQFRDTVMKSAEVAEKRLKETGTIERVFKKGYPDLVPLNSFFMDGEFVFFDQEFCIRDYPVKALLSRMVETFFAGNPSLQRYVTRQELYERYGLTEHLDVWHTMEWTFLAKLRKEKELSTYHKMHRRDSDITYNNRLHMNYSAEDYQRLFVDVFRDADTRKVILFGSGLFAKRFLDMYGRDYEVAAILDNQKEKWGTKLDGIEIQSPELLKHLSPGEYKLIICIKNYLSVMEQLDNLGIGNYSIFDPSQSYPDRPRKKEKAVGTGSPEEAEPRRFHKGYISGVFDLFHVGHLNLLKRAKEQCDYLIVGVVTDEGVEKYKKVKPYIPFEERLSIVQACRYVDEAVAIPFEARGIEAAYQKFRFDCQFCGSDYEKDPAFKKGKKYLEDHGAELIIFPYTEGTSSTKLREKLG